MTVTGRDAHTEAPATSALFVYGVARADADLPRMKGVAGNPITAVVHGDVMAVVGEVDVEESVMRKADLTAYHQVLDRLAVEGPVVPVRFGSALPDEQGVIDGLLRRSDELVALLDALEGRSQLTLRARYVEEAVLAEVVADDPVIRDLNDRTRGVPEQASWAERMRLGELVAQAVDRRRHDDAADLLDLVLPYAVEHREVRGTGLDHVVEVALLVDDERRAELEEALESYAEAVHERIRLRLLGPLAPYDFVGDARWG
ncbi:GvpL/GvpF family gas vesicle protein [Nocardioides bizhenqiangii]|uniref:GvpL/GvpF family gas vesicle protein n=1 Tax=Nocardioides bizhenqiangii TaxID=3095076 RepID=A0ABZ0ZU82_9ACTN|nr:GvpL/GvpF family gas vesicle protein [Nocardioides sp. HM61]WQQ27361.1 GvpL/GvpF family gas vesicle protein [Nocardioides sp. HM61]